MQSDIVIKTELQQWLLNLNNIAFFQFIISVILRKQHVRISQEKRDEARFLVFLEPSRTYPFTTNTLINTFAKHKNTFDSLTNVKKTRTRNAPVLGLHQCLDKNNCLLFSFRRRPYLFFYRNVVVLHRWFRLCNHTIMHHLCKLSSFIQRSFQRRLDEKCSTPTLTQFPLLCTFWSIKPLAECFKIWMGSWKS